MLGNGGFCTVCNVEKVVVNEVYDISNEQAQVRSDFAASLIESKYVIKTLRTDLPEEEYVKGIVDLAIESEFLSVLKHPNVISMRALANSDPHESKFFVLLDRLVTTLDKKFNQWRKIIEDHSGYWLGPFGYCCAKEKYLYQTWLERVQASRDIANAMYYLHSNQIIYRDLKPGTYQDDTLSNSKDDPLFSLSLSSTHMDCHSDHHLLDNLGFDAGGTLKVFDFGLAKRVTPSDRIDNGLYLLTGNTGSLRYMAPEVARGDPYDQRVDAYSFGILFWQICSLQTPYAGLSTGGHSERVVQGGQRPKPDRSWPLNWTDLMTRCWNSAMVERPEFDEISLCLEQQLEEMRNNEGEVPSRASEIKAKKARKATATERLDVDTRIATDQDGPVVMNHHAELV
jgi:serine/threonine protein kinase